MSGIARRPSSQPTSSGLLTALRLIRNGAPIAMLTVIVFALSLVWWERLDLRGEDEENEDACPDA
jgi:hypothetical protein